MKKRSLFAAVAMLIVSAIVLTSATYAWFASGTEVNVDRLDANISNSDGSIMISADGQNWTNRVTSDMLAPIGGNSLTETLSPISVNPTNLNLAAGSITSGVFTASTASAGTYIKYTVYVKSDVKTDAAVNPTFNFGAGFLYGLVKTETAAEGYSTMTVRCGAAATGKYYPVVANSGEVADANGNSIIDDVNHDAYTANGLGTPASFDEVGSNYLGDLVTPDSNGLRITLEPGVAQAITVLMWAEGQNTACRGTVDADCSVALNLTKVAAAATTNA